MKYFLCTFLLTLVIPVTLFSGEPDKKLHEMGLYPTVKLLFQECDCPVCRENPESGLSVGSGVIIRSEKNNGPILQGKHAGKYVNVVLTTAHNVDAAVRPVKILVGKYKDWSEIDGFDEFSSIVYAKDKDLDIAVMLFVSEKQMPVAKLGIDKKLYLGDKVIRIGYGLGDDIRFDEGKITSVKTVLPASMAGKGRMNAHTVFGDSGGPVYDKNYNVIGLTYAIRTEGMALLTEQSYFARVSDIKTWNESINNSVGFVYKASDKLPVVALFDLWLSDHKIIGEKK
jgi:S1-C subfamily serine protease